MMYFNRKKKSKLKIILTVLIALALLTGMLLLNTHRQFGARLIRGYGENKYGDFIELEYDHEKWNKQIAGLEQEPERGRRCEMCFYLRLKNVMEYAKMRGITHVASVLGVSRYKDLAQVNRAAYKAADETGVKYLEIEGRKGGMQELRCHLIKDFDLYNQRYCGCQFSMSEKTQ